MPRGDRRWTNAHAALALILLLASSALFPGNQEGTNPLPPVQGSSGAQSALTLEELSTFLEPALRMQLALFGIPGAAVAVVQGNKTLYLGGLGKADLASGEPVSARKTLFRTGSVSKLVTWTAVMQLVEQGKLDLHANINRYLDAFQVPAPLPEPVTLAHLLTHTAEFEDRGFGFYARSEAGLMPLDAFLAARMPARIFAPGEVSAYSNYGAALAGYLVERVSGLSFEDYVEARILTPLGMSASSFRQPLPSALASRLATGYRSSRKPGAFEWDLAVPAGAFSSTAADMARFMIAHLNGGRLGTTRILKAATVEAMQQRRFTNHPAVSGLTYGFQELFIAGQRILAQPGDMLHFTAALFLIPERKLGLFVAYNRGRAAGAPMELLRAFLARFPPAPPALVPYTTDQTVIQRYLTTPDEKQAARAVWTNAAMVIPATFLFFTVGTALFVFYRANPGLLHPFEKSDQLVPWFIATRMPAGLAGLVIAGVFAAAMSSLDSSMHAAATAFTTDFVRRLSPGREETSLLRIARGLTIAFGLLGTGTAMLMATADIRFLWDYFRDM